MLGAQPPSYCSLRDFHFWSSYVSVAIFSVLVFIYSFPFISTFLTCTEAEKEEEADDNDDMDGLPSDDEDDGDVSDKEMGIDDEDGDEADSIKLQKLAAQVASY